MRLQHSAAEVRASFDDPNLVSCAGLEPVMRLAQACDLHGVVAERLRMPGDKGANGSGKVAAVVAGMVTGADSVDDLDVIRHGGMPVLFGGVYAPSTLGEFLRAFTHGHVRQLQAASREFLVELARRTPLLPGAGAVTFIDVDSLLRRVFGKQKQGAAFGHTKVGGYPDGHQRGRLGRRLCQRTRGGDAFDYRPFAWTREGGFRQLPVHPGDLRSQALAVNDDGLIVGLSRGPSGLRAVVWLDGMVSDLNDLAPGYDGHLLYAGDVNDDGVITGQAVNAAGVAVPFVATPIEP